MINDSINFLVESIKKSPLIVKNGCYYQKISNFFPNQLLQELVKINDTYKLEKLETQEHTSRFRLSYEEPIIKMLNLIFHSKKITNALEAKFDVKLKPKTTDVWLDSVNFFLPPHVDDPRIKLSIQIYLGDNNIGTALFDSYTSTQPYEVFEYKLNSGYVLLNNSKSFHGTSGKVTDKNILRKSVYVRYKV